MIEDIIRGFEEEQAKVDVLRQKKQKYAELTQIFKENDYDKSQIKDQLNRNRAETLGALFWAMEEGELKLESDLGRKTWRNVIEYSTKNMPKDNLFRIKAELYLIGKKTDALFLDSIAEFIGMCVMGMTAGIVPWYWVSNKIRSCVVNRYVKKLYLE